MDIVAALRYVFDHNQQVIAGLVVFILITAILLFLRAIGQESSGPIAARAVASPLDIGAIETAFKKIIVAQAANSHAPLVKVSADVSGSNVVNTAAVAERDAKVQTLAREIDRLTKELATKESASFGSAQPEVDSGRLMELQDKIDELQGKLSEYEIIEDDIADLSRYKDENAELRNELERLKKETGARIDAVPQVSTPASVSISAATDAPSAFERVAPVVSSGIGETGDLVMKEFASSIQIEISPGDIGGGSSSVLNDDLDTEKMLAEVAGLSASGAGDEDDALSERLDTDKLLSEVNSLSPAVATAAAPAAQLVSPGRAEAPALEDDLLAEFKETNDGGQG